MRGLWNQNDALLQNENAAWVCFPGQKSTASSGYWAPECVASMTEEVVVEIYLILSNLNSIASCGKWLP